MSVNWRLNWFGMVMFAFGAAAMLSKWWAFVGGATCAFLAANRTFCAWVSER